MRKILLLLLVASLSVILSGCNKQQKSVNANPSEGTVKKEVINETDEAVADTIPDEEYTEDHNDEDDAFSEWRIKPGEINEIKNEWRTRVIKVFTDNKSPEIHQYVQSFIASYPYTPNDLLNNYIIDYKNNNLLTPESFLKKGSSEGEYQTDHPSQAYSYKIIDHPKSGYMSISANVQYDHRFEYCYWKRNNGHRLFAAYMNGEYENPSMNERLLAFYDYNPATQKMTPEPELTDMVEEKVKGFSSWVMRLPDKGKDIEVYVYQENDDDSEDEIELEFDMEWNGQSFTIESIEDFED